MLFEDEYFVDSYIARWKELRKNVLSNENLECIIDEMVSELSEVQKRNFEKWQILGKYVWPNPEPYAKTYLEEISNLKEWLIKRTKWIDENINTLLNYN